MLTSQLAIIGFALVGALACILESFSTRYRFMEFQTDGFEAFLTNPQAEKETGVWLNLGRLRIRGLRAGGANRRFEETQTKLAKPYRKALRSGRMSAAEFREKIQIPSYAHAVIMDWEGPRDTEGRPVSYSPDACIAFFKQFPEVFSEVESLLAEAGTFLDEEVEEVIETLGKP
jgi:hypothetical protein